MQIFLFIIAILLFAGLVLVHEGGHFLAARLSGVSVEEFGLGFPPRAWAKRLTSGMVLSLNWLPVGGFVKLKGEHDGDRSHGSFGSASLGAKTRILLAGVFANLVAAVVILTILALIGMPQLITKNEFGQGQYSVKSDTHISKQDVLAIYVEKNSPAARAGLSSLDKITSIDSGGRVIKTNTADKLKQATDEFAGETVRLNYTHNTKAESKTVKLRSKTDITANLLKQAGLKSASQVTSIEVPGQKPRIYHINNSSDFLKTAQYLSGTPVLIKYKNAGQELTKKVTLNAEGYLGVEPYQLTFTRSGWSAPITAIGFTWQLIKLTVLGIGHALAGLGSLIAGATTGNSQARQNGQAEATSQVGGPVIIVKILWGAGLIGYQYMLAIIAVVSLSLAVFNVLPIPALDGGRLFMILFSRLILRRPLSKLAEERAVATGMALLLALVVLITIVDVRR
ncbi:MAG TPA: RIP metalloprotease RseP [Candidatus Saccharimonadales bacterium]|nr:RIP metalloprotease RseP [Candidatus Saccharimonadales bacterium]